MRDLDFSSGFVTNWKSELRMITKAFRDFYFLICQVQAWADQQGPFQLKEKKKKRTRIRMRERKNERKQANILNKQKKIP